MVEAGWRDKTVLSSKRLVRSAMCRVWRSTPRQPRRIADLVPAGLMDDDLGTDIKVHIFCGSRADWDRESPDAKHYEEWPAQ